MTKQTELASEVELLVFLDKFQNILNRVTIFKVLFLMSTRILRCASKISKPKDDGSHEEYDIQKKSVANEWSRSLSTQQRKKYIFYCNNFNEVALLPFVWLFIHTCRRFLTSCIVNFVHVVRKAVKYTQCAHHVTCTFVSVSLRVGRSRPGWSSTSSE